MVCGSCSELVEPKYPLKWPDEYFRCSMCKIAFHQGVCSGSNDWFRLDRNQRAVWKCVPCQKIAKAAISTITVTKPSKSQTKRKRSSKPKTRSRATTQNSQTSASQNEIADLGAVSPAVISPDEKRLRCDDDEQGNSSFSEHSGSETDEASVVDLASVVNLDFVQPFPDGEDQKKCNLHIMSALATLTKMLQVSRADIFDGRLITNKILEENEQLKGECAALRSRCEGYEARFTALENQVQANTARIETTETRLDDKDVKDAARDHKHRLLDDYGRVANVIITGTPKTSTVKESVAVIRALASKVKLDISYKDIFRCHALPDRAGAHRIIVRFTSGLMKDSFSQELRGAGIIPKDMGWYDSTTALQISDHLSPDTATLLGAAKRKLSMLHKGNFKHVWMKDGRVLARVRDKTPYIEIKCAGDIDKAVQYGIDTLSAISKREKSSQPPSQESAMEVQHHDAPSDTEAH